MINTNKRWIVGIDGRFRHISCYLNIKLDVILTDKGRSLVIIDTKNNNIIELVSCSDIVKSINNKQKYTEEENKFIEDTLSYLINLLSDEIKTSEFVRAGELLNIAISRS